MSNENKVVLPNTVSDEQIKAVFLANGFTIKEGLTDLKPYVYQAARALLATATGLPAQADGFGSAEHWKEKAQYWAGVAHRLRQEALRGEPVDGIIAPQAQTGFVTAEAYDRLQALCDSQAARILAFEDAKPVHWRAVLDPEQAPHQLKTSMHAVGFRDQQSAESWIAERLDFDGWRYTLEPLYAAPQAQEGRA